MRKFYIFIEYAYLLFAIFFLVVAFLNWNSDSQKPYLYLAFSAVAVFMYFFKKKFRKRIENNDKKN